MRDDSAELTAELIVDGVVPRTPVISPDGRWVAYAAAPAARPAERDLAALWLAAADGSTPPRPLTDGSAADDQLAWAPDSAWLWFRSDRGGSAQLYRTGPDGREPEALTGWGGGITAALPLAGGRLAAVIAADEPTAAARLAIADHDDAIVWDRRVPPDRLRLLDLNTGEWRVVAGLGDRHVVEIAQRPDGGPLAVISWAGPEIDPGEVTSELHVVDPATGSARDLGRAGTGAASLAWWRDGGPWHLAYVATPGPNGGRAVFDLIIPEAGTSPAGHANLTGGLTACPVSLAPVADGPPLALFADGLDSAIYRLDPARSAFRLQSAWPGWAGALTASRSGAVIAVLASAAPEPADVYAGRPDRPLRRLSDSRRALRRVRWGVQARLAYRAADGLGLDGLLILPPGRSRAGGPFPMVTLVHGGPYGRFADQLMIDPHAPAQWLAADGYAVFLPNPRGGQGHGRAFAAAATGTIGVGDWADILTGIDLLVAEGVADPERLGISGWSHGGFMAAWAVGQTGRFRAAIMGAGISDWGMLVATGEGGAQEAELGGSCGWEGPGPHPHDQISPVSYAARVRTPVLILHGEDDTNVPLSQAVYFHRALRRFGAEHEFIVYPREGHGVAERGHQLDVLHRSRAWFGRWLRDPPPGGPGYRSAR